MINSEYRQPTHREELERELVHGASSQIAHAPENAAAIAKGIKTVLDELAPVVPHPVALASAVMYPAIERAMGELSKLHPEFNMEVNRAFNLLHDAFWSECPAPASAAPKRPETPAVEPAGLPVIDPGPDSLEREIQAKANRGPRVTPAALQAEIVSEHYFTAADGVIGQQAIKTIEDAWDIEAPAPLQLLTFCVLLLKNGAKVVGINYGAIDPAQHSAEIGRQKARAQAVDKVYELLGFRLRDELARPVLTDADAAADLAGKPRPDNPTAEAADFLASVKACDLSGDAPCEACQ